MSLHFEFYHIQVEKSVGYTSGPINIRNETLQTLEISWFERRFPH